MLILLFPGKLLSSGQSRIQSVKTPVSHLGGARISRSAFVSQIAAGARRACPADAAVARREEGGRRPAPWEWDAALLGCLLHSSLNTSVTALHHFVSELSGGMGGRWDELFRVLPVVLSYFCMLEWCWPWLYVRGCDIYCHDTPLLRPALVEPVLLHREMSIFIYLLEAPQRLTFPSLLLLCFTDLTCLLLKCTKTISLLNIVCWNSEKAINKQH